MAVKNEFERMRKANLLLSRAVAVQHGKLQEASQKEEELAQKDQVGLAEGQSLIICSGSLSKLQISCYLRRKCKE